MDEQSSSTPDQFLVISDDLFPAIRVDFERISLMRHVAVEKNAKVTPNILTKLEDCDSLEDLFNVPTTSSSSRSQESAAPRRFSKRKQEEEPQQEKEKCPKCGCLMLRVVDTQRPDGKKVLECMKTACLASVKLTNLPVGTILGDTEQMSERSAYNSMEHYYPLPSSAPTIPEGEMVPEDREQRDQNQLRRRRERYEIGPDGSIYIDVPGQETRARLI